MTALANPNWTFPFRVNYDISNWKLIADQLHKNHKSIPLQSRMQLIIDAEFYLLYSGIPEIYLYILGYLSRELEISVLLIGLDAIYRFIDTFRAARIIGIILIYIREVLEQIDRVLDESRMDREIAAVWLIDPNRLAHLYQLRCAAGSASCELSEKVSKWLEYSGLSEEDHYLQMTAVCHHLFTNEVGSKEIDLVINGLRQSIGKWTTEVQLATCVHDQEILRQAAKNIVETRNAAIYAAVLQDGYSLLYNEKFREKLWEEFALLSLQEKKLLFSVESRHVSHIAKIFMHSVRSSSELQKVMKILPSWESKMQIHLEYLRRKYLWMNEVATPRIENFLVRGKV